MIQHVVRFGVNIRVRYTNVQGSKV